MSFHFIPTDIVIMFVVQEDKYKTAYTTFGLGPAYVDSNKELISIKKQKIFL